MNYNDFPKPVTPTTSLYFFRISLAKAKHSTKIIRNKYNPPQEKKPAILITYTTIHLPHDHTFRYYIPKTIC